MIKTNAKFKQQLEQIVSNAPSGESKHENLTIYKGPGNYYVDYLSEGIPRKVSEQGLTPQQLFEQNAPGVRFHQLSDKQAVVYMTVIISPPIYAGLELFTCEQKKSIWELTDRENLLKPHR